MPHSSDAFDGLEPTGLWTHFAAITHIPRPSKREEKMAEYVRHWALSRSFLVREDRAGNLVVVVSATAGREKAPTIVLQAHLDMVCEKVRGSSYDAETGNILVVRKEDWIIAPETTLGADNGLACAAMLWLAEETSCAHGPLELLFTVDEETGLTGALHLDPALITGRILLNLDSEEDWILCVGCAGGARTHFQWAAARQAIPLGWRGLNVSFGGVKGGHSGVDIDKHRLNAIKALVRLLQAAGVPLMVSSLNGGNKDNAIPRDASAEIFYSPHHHEAVQRAIARAHLTLQQEYRGLDDGSRVTLTDATAGTTGAFSEKDSRTLLDFLRALPSGVLAMCADLPGLVETSSHLAVIKTLDADSDAADGQVEVTCSSRSSVAPTLRDVLDSIQAAARLAGATFKESDGYPGWKPDMSSPILALAHDTYRGLFQSEPTVAAVHAGLETGLLGQKIPGLDMLSFGPTIKGPHAPDERLSITSVHKFCRLLTALLDRVSKE